MKREETDFSILDWWKKVIFSNYFNFSGRARRAEYWYFVLVHYAIIFGLFILTAVLNGLTNNNDLASIPSLVSIFYIIGTLIPVLAVTVRRLHDTNKSGLLLLTTIIPIVGSIASIVLFVFFCIEGDRFNNDYGVDPKNPNGSFNHSGPYSIFDDPDRRG